MVDIAQEHITQIIRIEAEIQYDGSPPADREPFVVLDRDSPVLISAPHGARTFRNNETEVWHEEDEYTAGLALLLGELCKVSVIATTFKNDAYDPNHTRDDGVQFPYKEAIRSLIKDKDVRFVIDLHGAALHSSRLDPNQTIDLGYRAESADERSMTEEHVQVLEQHLQATAGRCDPSSFVVDRNRFRAKGKGTITSYVFRNFGPKEQTKVEAIQIEMKPQVRIAHRFPTATLYKSCGPYDANPNCVVHTIQALAHFIEYLKAHSRANQAAKTD